MNLHFYTTSIIYKPIFLCYDVDVVKRNRDYLRPGKDKDMRAMNKLYAIYNNIVKSAHLDKAELGVCFVHSSLDKHRREDFVLET